jgi:hypothetical protein
MCLRLDAEQLAERLAAVAGPDPEVRYKCNRINADLGPRDMIYGFGQEMGSSAQPGKAGGDLSPGSVRVS